MLQKEASKNNNGSIKFNEFYFEDEMNFKIRHTF